MNASMSTVASVAAWSGSNADRGEDRVDEAVQPLDLLDRAQMPRCCAARGGAGVARLASLERRLVGQEVGVRADDGERRAELVGDERDELVARPVQGA